MGIRRGRASVWCSISGNSSFTIVTDLLVEPTTSGPFEDFGGAVEPMARGRAPNFGGAPPARSALRLSLFCNDRTFPPVNEGLIPDVSLLSLFGSVAARCGAALSCPWEASLAGALVVTDSFGVGSRGAFLGDSTRFSRLFFFAMMFANSRLAELRLPAFTGEAAEDRLAGEASEDAEVGVLEDFGEGPEAGLEVGVCVCSSF